MASTQPAQPNNRVLTAVLWLCALALVVTGLLATYGLLKPGTALVEHVLLLISGLTNLVAIIDICRHKQFNEDGIRRVLVTQLVVLGVILGFDFFKLVPPCLGLVGGLLLAGFLIYKARRRFEVSTIIALSIIAAALLIVPQYMNEGKILAQEAVREMYGWRIAGRSLAGSPDDLIAFVGQRLHAWVHLLVIPLLYLWGDSMLKDKLPTSAKGLPLDRHLMAVGVACVIAGAAVGQSTFEAGAAAVMLLLGNWVYSSYVAT